MQAVDVEQLIDVYGQSVYGLCRSLAVSRTDADDLYQQTFLRALELSDRINAQKNPKAFLLSIAVSLFKSDLRKKARRNRILPIATVDEQEWVTIADTGEKTDEILFSKELRKEINGLVQRLDDKLRIPILLHYTAELPLQEIARILKLPQGTVKSRLHTARSKIKEKLEASGYAKF